MGVKEFQEAVKGNAVVRGAFTASIKVNCVPCTRFNLRPIHTVKGEILEWHLLISESPSPDWMAASGDSKPAPGSPILTPHVIRFHPDDVETSIDLQEPMQEYVEAYETLRFQRD
jgi:hypothetical protein